MASKQLIIFFSVIACSFLSLSVGNGDDQDEEPEEATDETDDALAEHAEPEAPSDGVDTQVSEDPVASGNTQVPVDPKTPVQSEAHDIEQVPVDQKNPVEPEAHDDDQVSVNDQAQSDDKVTILKNQRLNIAKQNLEELTKKAEIARATEEKKIKNATGILEAAKRESSKHAAHMKSLVNDAAKYVKKLQVDRVSDDK